MSGKSYCHKVSTPEKGMILILLFGSASDRIGHLFFYPSNVVRRLSVDSWFVIISTTVTPTHNTHQCPSTIHLTNEWATRITLQIKKGQMAPRNGCALVPEKGLRRVLP